jgi:hypothetical protein
VFKHAPTSLVALSLSERARVVLRPDGCRVPGNLRGLDWVNVPTPCERAEGRSEVLAAWLASAQNATRPEGAYVRPLACR